MIKFLRTHPPTVSPYCLFGALAWIVSVRPGLHPFLRPPPSTPENMEICQTTTATTPLHEDALDTWMSTMTRYAFAANWCCVDQKSERFRRQMSLILEQMGIIEDERVVC
ncbi:hypothetical protein BS47DRAFT_525654 [Hydnum rufescens UP504]|uniref:Uncharacterized protein n=1 Tax=Hydnum rufescens UP504 TaxID=1448309 RepID=A0A9P6B4Q8_9AGAM|nr:hypothetical protein BS47DRAFT_525654 [Hydnum rufescens UP504]